VSHYNKINVVFKDAECLVKALMSVGYSRDQIEVHKEPVALYGYHGEVRPEMAHVVIRRNNVGSASNDVGFIVGEKSQAIISDYDRGSHFTMQKLGLVTQHYVKQFATVSFANKRMETEVLQDGTMRIKVRV
jgi:hypothetical protein